MFNIIIASYLRKEIKMNEKGPKKSQVNNKKHLV